MTPPSRLDRPDAIDAGYRRLLRLYPEALRREFGEEMAAFFHARRTAARARGWRALARFCAASVIDFAGSLWRERRPRFGYGGSLFRRVGGHLAGAARSLRRAPGSSVAAIALLALAIGAATAVFGAVNAALFRPLPFDSPDRIVVLWETRPDREIDRNVVAGHEFPIWSERARTFERLAAMTFQSVTLTGAGDPMAISGVRVTSGFTDVLGVRPVFGRGFAPDEDAPGSAPVVLVSHRLWRDRLGGGRDALGQEIRLNDRPFQIVGVMPEGFHFPMSQGGIEPDVWTAMAEPIQRFVGRHYLHVIGRLRPGATVADASADLSRVANDLTREMPEMNKGHGARVESLHASLVRDTRASLLLLLGAVVGLMLIGCSNVAGLLVARGVTRRPEMAMRLALGARRRDVVGLLAAEGLLLSLVAAAIGIGLAALTARIAPRLIPVTILRLDAIPIDATVLGFALLAALLTGVLSAVAPARQLRGVDITTLRGGTRGGVGRSRMRHRLVIGQIALTVVLVLATGLVARGLARLQAVDPGFVADGLLAVDIGLSGSRYSSAVRQQQFFRDLVERARLLPGVASASTTNLLPLGGAYSGIAVSIEGRPAPAPGEDVSARYRVVGADYFETLGIPIRSGRAFAASDARVAVPLIRWFPQQPAPAGADLPQPRPMAIINEHMAREFWPGVDPVGREFRALLSPPLAIIGVVADTRNESLQSGPRSEFYLLDQQEPQSVMTLLVRSNGDPATIAPAVRTLITQMDPALAIAAARPLTDVRALALQGPRFTSGLLASFTGLALLLMAVGIYGLIAFNTTQRLPEIGVRVALGADRAAIVRTVLRQALGLAAAGLALGALAAALVARYLEGQFFGVNSLDPITWSLVSALVFVVVLGASWRPARRAAGVDPAAVLRRV